MFMPLSRRILLLDAAWDTVLGAMLFASAVRPGSLGLDFSGGLSRAVLAAAAVGSFVFALAFVFAARGWRTRSVALTGAGVNALAVPVAVAVAVGADGVSAGGVVWLLSAAGICAAFAAAEWRAFGAQRQHGKARRRDDGPSA